MLGLHARTPCGELHVEDSSQPSQPSQASHVAKPAGTGAPKVLGRRNPIGNRKYMTSTGLED